MKPLENVDEELKRLADTLTAKREAAIKRLGSKWLLHPDNKVQKLKDVKPNILSK